MIPAASGDIPLEYEEQPTRTYCLHREKKAISGFIDGLEAIEQAVYKCLQTERYDWLIYSWDYGVELQDLYGQPLPFVYSELKRRIREALLQDERIIDVCDFVFTHQKGTAAATFRVKATLGEFTAERSVAVV